MHRDCRLARSVEGRRFSLPALSGVLEPERSKLWLSEPVIKITNAKTQDEKLQKHSLLVLVDLTNGSVKRDTYVYKTGRLSWSRVTESRGQSSVFGKGIDLPCRPTGVPCRLSRVVRLGPALFRAGTGRRGVRGAGARTLPWTGPNQWTFGFRKRRRS